MKRLIVEKDEEDFKKDLQEFLSDWEKEAEDLKNRELTEDDSRHIFLIFEKAKLDLDLWYYSDLVSLSDYRKLALIENKLWTSLAIARSNYRSKHRTMGERIVDSIGGLFHIFGKGH